MTLPTPRNWRSSWKSRPVWKRARRLWSAWSVSMVAFQPHLYTRTQAFADEFGRALGGADVVFVTGIYSAREEPIEGVSAELVSDSARQKLGEENVHHVEALDDLVALLRNELAPGDVLLTLGAGDIGDAAHSVFAELERSHVDA